MTNRSSDSIRSKLEVRRLGRLDYARGLELQERKVAARRASKADDELWLLEHNPVVTLGRGSHDENLLLDEAALAARGIQRFEAGRGGDVTYHGPGQLVGYPILQLHEHERDAHRFLRNLEETLIRAVAAFGISAGRVDGLTGIWVGDDKLAAIGVRFNTGWITSHGFALNVTTDLSGFETIVPCGIQGRGVTSMERLLGSAPGMAEIAGRVAETFAEVFERELVDPANPAERLAGSSGRPVC